jgi:glycosyltransferase involved in cell wall biosynthesis
MSRRFRVLLISPVPELDPPNGDVTYTEQLLKHPPDDVEYVTYPQALRAGQLRELYRRHARHERTSAPTIRSNWLRVAREALINKARGQGLLFREPFRHFELTDPRFDLVHSHVFSVRLYGQRRPLVVSNSAPVHALYADAFGGRPRVTALRARLDATIARQTGVTHSTYGHRDADVVVCFSEYLRTWFLERDGDPGRFVVVPPAVEVPEFCLQPADGHLRIGFIGDWYAKGGDTLLDAVRCLGSYSDVTVTVVGGSKPVLSRVEARRLRVEWLPRLPRKRLLEAVIPSFSIFVYPSRFDGLPLTLLEVMAAGVPVVVSDYGALPEVVDHGKAGIVVPRDHPKELAAQIERLRDPALRARLGAAARARIDERFSYDVVTTALADAYKLATARAHRD